MFARDERHRGAATGSARAPQETNRYGVYGNRRDRSAHERFRGSAGRLPRERGHARPGLHAARSQSSVASSTVSPKPITRTVSSTSMTGRWTGRPLSSRIRARTRES